MTVIEVSEADQLSTFTQPMGFSLVLKIDSNESINVWKKHCPLRPVNIERVARDYSENIKKRQAGFHSL